MGPAVLKYFTACLSNDPGSGGESQKLTRRVSHTTNPFISRQKPPGERLGWMDLVLRKSLIQLLNISFSSSFQWPWPTVSLSRERGATPPPHSEPTETLRRALSP